MLLANDLQEMEGGGTPNQEGEGGEPTKQQQTILAQGLLEGRGGGTPYIQRLPTARKSGKEGATRE